MTELGRRRWAALLVAAGVGVSILSIVAEDIGLGSRNGIFGTWQKAGAAAGLLMIVGGALWFSPPERWIDPGPFRSPESAVASLASIVRRFLSGLGVVFGLWLFVRWDLAGWMCLAYCGSVLFLEILWPEQFMSRSVRRVVMGAAIVAAVALTWNATDDWGIRCGPGHPAYETSMEWGPSCVPRVTIVL